MKTTKTSGGLGGRAALRVIDCRTMSSRKISVPKSPTNAQDELTISLLEELLSMAKAGQVRGLVAAIDTTEDGFRACVTGTYRQHRELAIGAVAIVVNRLANAFEDVE